MEGEDAEAAEGAVGEAGQWGGNAMDDRAQDDDPMVLFGESDEESGGFGFRSSSCVIFACISSCIPHIVSSFCASAPSHQWVLALVGSEAVWLFCASHSVSPQTGYSSSSGDEEDRELNAQRRSAMLSAMTFDTSVPASHSYLGETRSATACVPVGICREVCAY